MPKISRSPEYTQLRSNDTINYFEPMPAAQSEHSPGYIDQYYRNSEPRFSKATKAIASLAAGTVMYGATLVGLDVVRGIHAGKEAVEHSHAEVHAIYTDDIELYPMYQHHATFVLTGLGTKDPSNTAQDLAVHKKVGRVFAIEYSNNDLNTNDIAKRTIEAARANDISEISFDGYSAGGPIALDIAAHIHRLAPDLDIISITLNSSPLGKDSGKDSLTQQSRDGIDIMEKIMGINEDFAYYRHGHVAVEVLNRSERFIERTDYPASDKFTLLSQNSFSYNGVSYEVNFPKMLDEIQTVVKKLNDPQAASAMLIWRQAGFIVHSDYKDNIKELPDDVLYIYTRSKDSSADAVVDIDTSEANFVDVMQKLKKEYKVLHADVGHANPSGAPDAYSEMITRSIHPQITRKLLVHIIEREKSRLELMNKEQNKALEPAVIDTDHPN